MEILAVHFTACAPNADCSLGVEVNGSVVDSIGVPNGVGHEEVSDYKALTGVFVSPDAFVRIVGLSGVGVIEDEPSRIDVTLLVRPAALSAPAVRINAGGNEASPFAADQSYVGGATAATSSACNTSAVTDPAPQAVYKSARRITTNGTLTYTVTGLARGLNYKVRLHFNQWIKTGIDDEVFHIRVVGATTATRLNWDIIDEAGGVNTAAIYEATLAADSNGQIQVQLQAQAGNGGAYGASISGLEFVPTV